MQTKSAQGFTYQAVYRYLLGLIEAGDRQTEQKLPSLRQLAVRLNVSVSSTKYAYALLEDEGRLYARPKCGYFTRVMPTSLPVDEAPSLLDNVFSSARQPGMLALSSDAPAMLVSLQSPLLMLERELARQYPRTHAPLYQPFGEPQLRSALASRYTSATSNFWHAEQVYIGSDLRSVLDTALKALQLEGTVALVESPCSWAVLRQLQAAKIRVIEVALDNEGRFDLPALARLLEHEPVRLAVFSSTVSIPHGGLMPARDKAQICRWLADRDIWLFENDSYGELCFSPQASRFRDFADPQKLLVFSTFDKVIGAEAPFAFLLCRRYTAALNQQFLDRAYRLSPIRQKAVAKLYSSGRIDQHVAVLHAQLQQRMRDLNALLLEHGQGLFHITEPQGGAAFWLEATRSVDMRRVFDRLLAQRIVIAPGEIFSQQGAWRHHLRLSYTLDWSQDIARAIQQLAQAMADECVIP